MYARVRELLTMNEELKKARKAFDDVKFVQGGKWIDEIVMWYVPVEVLFSSLFST